VVNDELPTCLLVRDDDKDIHETDCDQAARARLVYIARRNHILVHGVKMSPPSLKPEPLRAFDT